MVTGPQTLPDDWLQRLRARAQRQRRSLNLDITGPRLAAIFSRGSYPLLIMITIPLGIAGLALPNAAGARRPPSARGRSMSQPATPRP